MRKIINSTYVTLDGVQEDPQDWSFTYFNEEAAALAHEQLFSSGALLMGRRTYEGFAEAWPGRDGDFADRINGMPKYVATTTLDKLDWDNSHLITGDLVTEVTKLKQEDGQDILMYGYGPVARKLMENGLLDELRLWVHPEIVGRGGPAGLLYHEGSAGRLQLADVKTFATGVVVLTLRAN
ncbi:dihydrofolate reductase family protein [Nonomuraea soli]|uniref:Dihydrofolate reductase n=1 Tax=Nonomuraea soli TaxID=1032476 RepID=A0A7W0CKP0_9ACTN|nr:dihydrofolate reductase family protein [Nonomuraea soli]MBA2892829.1 dihydrofolate reductase [Nonomuraea soli]